MSTTVALDKVAEGAGYLRASRLDLLSGPLDVFAKPITHDEIERRVQGTRHPQTPVTNKGPYTFILPPEGDSFLDMSRIKLFGEIRIMDGDGHIAGAEDSVALVNMIGGALMETITVNIDNFPINSSCSTDMPYKALIPTILSYGSDAAKTHLRCQGFEMDKPNRFENYNVTEVAAQGDKAAIPVNNGFVTRHKWTMFSKDFQFCCPLPVDFLRTDRLLVPGRELKLQMTRSSNEFLLLSNATNKNYRVGIKDLFLMYERVFLKPRVFETFMKTWTVGGVALYPSNQTTILRIPLPQNTTTFNIPYVFQGTLPQHIMLAFVDSDALHGSMKKNPFFFHHHFVNYIDLKINGMSVPVDPYRPSFTANTTTTPQIPMKYMREYDALMDNVGIFRADKGCQITFESFEGGCFILPYDLTPDRCNQYHHHAEKTGLIQLQLGFQKNLTTAVTLLVIMSHQQVVGLLKDKMQPIRFVF